MPDGAGCHSARTNKRVQRECCVTVTGGSHAETTCCLILPLLAGGLSLEDCLPMPQFTCKGKEERDKRLSSSHEIGCLTGSTPLNCFHLLISKCIGLAMSQPGR